MRFSFHSAILLGTCCQLTLKITMLGLWFVKRRAAAHSPPVFSRRNLGRRWWPQVGSVRDSPFGPDFTWDDWLPSESMEPAERWPPIIPSSTTYTDWQATRNRYEHEEVLSWKSVSVFGNRYFHFMQRLLGERRGVKVLWTVRWPGVLLM